METQSNAFLGMEKVSRLMRKFALPCVISLLVGALYNIVDQIYIANASYLGSYGLSLIHIWIRSPSRAAFPPFQDDPSVIPPCRVFFEYGGSILLED